VQLTNFSRIRSFVLRTFGFFAIFLAGANCLSAQARPSSEESGFTIFEEFRGSTSNQGQFTILDTSIGYDFNEHVGIDIGVPYYFFRATPNLVPGERHFWDNTVGDPYGDLRLTFNNRVLNYATIFSLSVPIAETGAFSTGRLGADWFNHFDRPIGPVTPYVNAGISNGLLDTRLVAQPFRIFDSFTSLGFLANAEGGVTLKIAKRALIGGSYYALEPYGSQKVYAANGVQNFFLQPNGPGDISNLTHDRGYSAFIRINPTRFMYIEPAYVHSIKLNQDAATLTVGFDIRAMLSGRR
jgi:hypothetical protein